MGVRVLADAKYAPNHAIMYCSTTDWAFGPVFSDSEDGEHDARERIESFLRWFKKNGGIPPYHYDDPRQLTDSQLETKYSEWRAQEEVQWKDEEAAERAKYEDSGE